MGVRAMALGSPGWVFIGTDTSAGKSKGIYRAWWDGERGTLTRMELAAKAVTPSFLAMGSGGRFLYAVNEGGTADDTVTAFSVERKSGALTELNRVKTGGAGPCYVSVHEDGRSAFVANYSAGSVSSFAVGEDGRLSEAVSHFVYSGHGPNSERQEKAHAHAAMVRGNWLLVNDLGLDRIVVYRIDRKTAALTEAGTWQARAGSGPRHVAFHPNGMWAYNLNELDSTVDLLAWDEGHGTLRTLGTVPTLPGDFDVAANRASEIAVTADGRFVFEGNRGHDSIAVFSVGKTGELTLVERVGCGGANPRAFEIDPTGRWLVVQNQDSNVVSVIPFDAKAGKLGAAVDALKVDAPMHMVFA